MSKQRLAGRCCHENSTAVPVSRVSHLCNELLSRSQPHLVIVHVRAGSELELFQVLPAQPEPHL